MERIKELLSASLEALGYPMEASSSSSSSSIQGMAELIHASMSTPGRVYHQLQHAFDVAQDMNCRDHPIPVLAALFHDIVYLSVDKQILPCQEAYLEGLVVVVDDKEEETLSTLLSRVQITIPKDNLALQAVDVLFDGHKPGKNTNEFLSAMVAVGALGNIVTKMEHMLALVACIEASVPFRLDDGDGKSPLDLLYNRLMSFQSRHAATHLHTLSETHMADMVKDAAFFANCDLQSFSSPNMERFLTTSWQLLPEWWEPLLSSESSLVDICKGIEKLLIIYEKIHPDRIFPSFQGFPSAYTIQARRKQASENMSTARRVALVRLCDIMIITEGLMEIWGQEGWKSKVADWGGTGPFLKRLQKSPKALQEDNLSSNSGDANDAMIVELLLNGVQEDHSWDACKSEWAAFLVCTDGLDAVLEAVQKCRTTKERCLDHLSSTVQTELRNRLAKLT